MGKHSPRGIKMPPAASMAMMPAPAAGPGPAAPAPGMRKGGKTKKMSKGGGVTRADGIATKGRTKGRFV